MSGTGVPNNEAPTRLTPMSLDQPVGSTREGMPVYPSLWFAQMIQRILSYLGQPGTSGQTLTEQVTNIGDIVTNNTTINNSSATFAGGMAVFGQDETSVPVPLPPLPAVGVTLPEVMARVSIGF